MREWGREGWRGGGEGVASFGCGGEGVGWEGVRGREDRGESGVRGEWGRGEGGEEVEEGEEDCAGSGLKRTAGRSIMREGLRWEVDGEGEGERAEEREGERVREGERRRPGEGEEGAGGEWEGAREEEDTLGRRARGAGGWALVEEERWRDMAGLRTGMAERGILLGTSGRGPSVMGEAGVGWREGMARAIVGRRM